MGGMDGAMVNEAGEGVQICKKSVQAQVTDIQKAIDINYLTNTSTDQLKMLAPMQLERLGRLDNILFKESGASNFTTLDLPEAYAMITERMMALDPNRSFFYSSGRSSNEASFVLHLFARLLGTNNVNNCSYYCHQASGVGMGKTLGTGTATIELQDLKKADLIFVIGANPASNHPRFLTELMECRRRGGHVVIINPVAEPGLKKFSIPSDIKSMVSGGSELASHYLMPAIGHDIHVLAALSYMIISSDQVNEAFVTSSTSGYETYKSQLLQLNPLELCKLARVEYRDVAQIAALYAKANNVVFTWAMGITHHEHGVQNVESIVNLAMLRGMLGRQHAGLLPLRGHSNVQGVGSMGVTPELKSLIFKNIEEKLEVQLPTREGWDTMTCMEKAMAGEVDLAWIQGGNLYASNPDLRYAEAALNKVKTKIYLTTTLNQGHVVPDQGEIFILPVLARDEEMQYTTQESMFNYVRMSEGGISRMKNARSETELIVNLASMVISENKFDFSKFILHKQIRKAIAATVPGFAELDNMDKDGKGFTIAGRIRHDASFGTSDGKALFGPVMIPEHKPLKEGQFRMMSVRSEGQFNSVIYEEADAWRGVSHRKVVFMHPDDIETYGWKPGQKLVLSNELGSLSGYELVPFDIARSCIMTYYPECNVLIGRKLDPQSKTPAFKHVIVNVSAV